MKKPVFTFKRSKNNKIEIIRSTFYAKLSAFHFKRSIQKLNFRNSGLYFMRKRSAFISKHSKIQKQIYRIDQVHIFWEMSTFTFKQSKNKSIEIIKSIFQVKVLFDVKKVQNTLLLKLWGPYFTANRSTLISKGSLINLLKLS